MHYKIINFFLFFLILSCTSQPSKKSLDLNLPNTFFLNKGFTLIYNDDLYKNKIVNKKIENRSLIIFQKNLKINTSVKITNLINSKNVIAKVGKSSDYPTFYNSVISKRISEELEIDLKEPYIEIKEILDSSSLKFKKIKVYKEEKKVATKAPIDEIQIKDLGISKKKKISVKKKEFKYLIKIADFYFEKSANEMKSKILNETQIKDISVNKLSSTKFRVYIGPFKTFDSLKKAYKYIELLNFENIELIKI